MPINAGHEFYEVEKNYLGAQDLDEKMHWLEEMIKKAPKHKSSEHFVAELKTRLKKLREKAEKSKKAGSGGKKGIRKEGYQFVLIGKTNSGKSLLLRKLTNAKPEVGEGMFTTKEVIVGTFEYEGVKAQIVDSPSIGSENFDKSLPFSADCLLVLVNLENGFKEYEELKEKIEKYPAKKIWVFNKADKLDINELRKGIERIKSNKLMGAVVSAESEMGLDVLKQLMFREMEVVRVYTKEPGKSDEFARAKEPMVLKQGACVRDVAEKILKGFSNKVKETRLTGPSGKFVNQKVGLDHKVKDLDVVEFHT